MKRFFIVLAALLVLAGPAFGQQAQPPVLDTVVQYNPVNLRASAAGSNTATITITGVTGQRVRIYWVTVQCLATPTTLVPTIVLTDVGASAVLFSTSSQTSPVTNPVGEYHWLPGLTFGVGNTVTVDGNTGGACSGGTLITVQADQF